MAANLQSVVQLLQASLDARQAQQAQQALEQEQRKPGFSLALLQIAATATIAQTDRLAAALYFKNFIRRNWTDADGNYKLPQEEVITIKQQIIGLMITVPSIIQIQLGEAVSVIAESDFFQRWDTLVDDLISRLKPDDPVTNSGVLQVAHSIFGRWRPLFRSDALFEEINHVLSKFSSPFLGLLANADVLVEESAKDQAKLKVAFSNLDILLKLFYDLSCQDLPPMFEENLPNLAGFLHKYLVYDNEFLHTDDEQASTLEFVRAGVLEVLTLYVAKYEEDFGPYVAQFIPSTWNLLATTGPDVKYDILVSKALQFLTSVSKIQAHSQSFNDENTLNQIVEKVIIPNLSLRDADVEIFEDEPIDFVRRDLEGPDSDTRRKSATDFLRQLLENPQCPVTKVVTHYVDHYLAEYAKSLKDNWRSKDLAIYLYTSIAAKGVATASHGIMNVNPAVDIGDFFQKNIASDLTGDSVEPILKMDALKYLYTFRSILTKEQWQQVFPLLVNRLQSSDYVVYTYASIVVERVLALTDANHQTFIEPGVIAPLSKDLLLHLFKLIEQNPAPEKVQENEFLMRCVMRVLIFLREAVLPSAGIVLQHLLSITQTMSANPSNPRFQYYHFEAFGAFIRFAAPSSPESLEKAIYQTFYQIINKKVEEFEPYVIQLLGFLLEINPSTTLPQDYHNMIGPLLTPAMWEEKGKVPALVRLLSAIMARASQYIVESDQLMPILGVFQKLNASPVLESHAFDLLEAVISSFHPDQLRGFFTTILTVIFQRLERHKTENYVLRLARFYHFVSAMLERGYGADFFIAYADEVQNDVFRGFYPGIILPETRKLARPLDRKIAVISLTKTLGDSTNFVERYKKGWMITANTMLAVLENPILPPTADTNITDQDVNDMAFGVGFTQLNTVRKAPVDSWPEIVDVKKWVGDYLKDADTRNGGRMSKYAGEMLSQEAQQALGSYMQR